MAQHNTLGKSGEDAAMEFLQSKGYKILHRN
jgi:Holliday junction resolvase-like predicted endonuclease